MPALTVRCPTLVRLTPADRELVEAVTSQLIADFVPSTTIELGRKALEGCR